MGVVGSVVDGCGWCVRWVLVWYGFSTSLVGVGGVGLVGGFCCWGAVGFHALHCWRLSCVGAVVMLVSRVCFLLLVLVVFLFVGWDVVVVVAFVRVVFLFIFVLSP